MIAAALLTLALVPAVSLSLSGGGIYDIHTAKLVNIDDAPAVQLRTTSPYVPTPDGQANTQDLDDALVAHDGGRLRICVRAKMKQRSGGVNVFVRRSAEQTVRIDLSRRWETRCAVVTVTGSGSGVQVTPYGPTLNRVWVRNVHLRPEAAQ